MNQIKKGVDKLIKKFQSFAGLLGREQFLGVSIVIGAVIISGTWIYTTQSKDINSATIDAKTMAKLEKEVLPKEGVVLPVNWGNLGKQMVDSGVIDMTKLETLYEQRGGLDDDTRKLLTETNNGQLIITNQNSGELLNLLWALGLANKNAILEKGEMVDKRYGGAGQFASTGGWTLSRGNAMDHYSRHSMIILTDDQQSLVDRVSRNIYRPCCGNSTHFPDCNHGMAMLGLLELMAAQGVNEAEMYKTALAVNSFWFPDTYLTIAQYFKSKGVEWDEVETKEVLGINFSSGAGYRQILEQVQPSTEKKGGSGCSN